MGFSWKQLGVIAVVAVLAVAAANRIPMVAGFVGGAPASK